MMVFQPGCLEIEQAGNHLHVVFDPVMNFSQ
jgi:hypothetical protein